MARRREQVSAWQRRNRRAQAKGYASYYDYRIHDYGRIAANKPAPTGEVRTRLRGHRSKADLVSTTSQGDILTMGAVERDKAGRLKRVRIDRIEDDGTETQFWLSGSQLDTDELEQLTSDLDAEGARFMLWYPTSGIDV